MRAREILDEDYNQNLESDLTNILVSVKGNNINRIPTAKLVDKMQQSGYSVTADSLIQLLQDNPVVSNASQDYIVLNPSETSVSGEDTEDSAEQVSDMAQAATNVK